MTNEMIEKCARALCAAEGLDPDGAVMHGFTTMRAWESREPRARAVLQTLMTPTDEMVEAGAWVEATGTMDQRCETQGVGRLGAKDTWTAMLTQALNEEEGE